VELARRVKAVGVDLIDASSGGNVVGAAISVEPGYQVGFAARIRKEAGLLTGAVGMIAVRHCRRQRITAIFRSQSLNHDSGSSHAVRWLLPIPGAFERHLAHLCSRY
jgi:hypothetical protein